MYGAIPCTGPILAEDAEGVALARFAAGATGLLPFPDLAVVFAAGLGLEVAAAVVFAAAGFGLVLAATGFALALAVAGFPLALPLGRAVAVFLAGAAFFAVAVDFFFTTAFAATVFFLTAGLRAAVFFCALVFVFAAFFLAAIQLLPT
jgi:hypothetical protein